MPAGLLIAPFLAAVFLAATFLGAAAFLAAAFLGAATFFGAASFLGDAAFCGNACAWRLVPPRHLKQPSAQQQQRQQQQQQQQQQVFSWLAELPLDPTIFCKTMLAHLFCICVAVHVSCLGFSDMFHAWAPESPCVCPCFMFGLLRVHVSSHVCMIHCVIMCRTCICKSLEMQRCRKHITSFCMQQ